jgi:hypothetical protein
MSSPGCNCSARVTTFSASLVVYRKPISAGGGVDQRGELLANAIDGGEQRENVGLVAGAAHHPADPGFLDRSRQRANEGVVEERPAAGDLEVLPGAARQGRAAGRSSATQASDVPRAPSPFAARQALRHLGEHIGHDGHAGDAARELAGGHGLDHVAGGVVDETLYGSLLPCSVSEAMSPASTVGWMSSAVPIRTGEPTGA